MAYKREVCILAKMQKKPCNEVKIKAERPMQELKTDIIKHVRPVLFPGENNHLITFIDDFSKYAKVYPIKLKSQVGECLEDFLHRARNLLR